MKLNFPLLDHSISLKAWTILTIESSSLFGNFVREVYHYSDECEVKFFDHKMTRLKETELMLITDVLGFDVNAPAILKLSASAFPHVASSAVPLPWGPRLKSC